MYQENNNSNRNSSNSIPTLDFGAFPSYKTKINKTLRNFTINTLKFHPNQQNDLNSENTRTTNSSKTLNKTLPSRNLFDFGLSPTKKSGISKRNLSRSGESKEIFKRNIFDINIMKISGFAHETIENLENSLKQIKCQNKEYQQMIENHLLNESKLKIYVQNLLEINGKLVVRLREKESVEEKNNSNFILQISKKNTLIDQNDYLNLNKENQKNIETLQKQTIEFNDERDYLQEKIENLNQKLEGLMKSYTYKEKMIDFYKNRLKLCQFKLENYPKSEKEQIKLLEDYIMDLLGENSKLNKALEKTDFESKKWQEKYFDFEKSKEILVPHNSNIEHNNKKRNNFIEDNKKVNNDRNQKEINKSDLSKVPMFLNGNHKNLRRSDFSFLHEKSPEKGLRPSKISKKLAFSNLNTPQEKILFDTTNLAGMNVEMYGEINVSPFCLKGGVENKENITVSSSKLSIPDILSFSDLTLENEIEKKSVIEEEFPIDCLPLPLPMSIFRSPMRSLSFEDKEDFFIADIKPNMKPQNKEFLEETLLDTNQNNTHPDIPTISCYTLKQLINKEIFGEKEVIIIDCRYLYEYEGGHIENSLNFTNPFDLESMFFKGLSQIKNKDNYIIIFHCEFSQKRGPKMYRFFRKKDREINESNYPSLLYPHIYLLDGGYNKFVKYNSCLCSNNGNYISMFDKKFKDECIQSTSDYNKAWKNKKEQIKQLNICRNHSFNF